MATKQTEAILEAIRGAEGPLSPAEIHDLARISVSTLGIATVYRTISKLVGGGSIVVVPLPGEPDRYESAEKAEKHHHHFRCDECGRVFDLVGCVSGLSKLVPPGFEVLGHDLTLTGRCSACAV
ncbi:MAG: transcriptional repressor [Planctomycetota bacterium]